MGEKGSRQRDREGRGVAGWGGRGRWWKDGKGMVGGVGLGDGDEWRRMGTTE